MECYQRPSKASFLERLNTEFRVSDAEGKVFGSLRLCAVRDLPSPDADGLRELECFGATFDCVGFEALGQGSYLLEQGDFQQALFFVPESATKMGLVIN